MAKQFRYFVGIDEAGRGPLAGPVAVAAVVQPIRMSRRVLDSDKSLGILRDSKHLSPKKRERWFGWLRKQQIARRLRFTSSLVGEKTIDRIGIVRAVKIGIRRVLGRLKIKPGQYRIVLDGGLKASAKYKNQQTVIRGDSTVPIIMLASIVAKIRRDRRLVRLAHRFPSYGFEIHKGYGTKKHYTALRRRGLSSIHRRSFLKKYFGDDPR